MSPFPTHGNTFLVESNPLEGWRYPLEIPNECVHLVPPDDDEMEVGTEDNDATFDKNDNRQDLQVAIAELINHQGEPNVAPSTGKLHAMFELFRGTILTLAVYHKRHVVRRLSDLTKFYRIGSNAFRCILTKFFHFSFVLGVVDEQPNAEEEWWTLFASVQPLNESVSFMPSMALRSQSNRKRSRSDWCRRVEEAHQKDVLLGRGINHSGDRIPRELISTSSFAYGACTNQDQTLIANGIYERVANIGRHFVEKTREDGHRHCVESYRHEARDNMSCNFRGEGIKRQRRK